MDMSAYMSVPGEKPLDRIPEDGGFCGIFRTIGCIGDSLSSGEFESTDEEGKKGYHDYFDYSWGQYIARSAGCKVYNFSKGGMTAKAYWDEFAEKNGFWDTDKLCQAYILALGCNDFNHIEHGSVKDIHLDDYNQNAETFVGYYARIIQRLKQMQPKARFFLMTFPRGNNAERDARAAEHAQLMQEIAGLFDYTYVLDFYHYAPAYDDEFRRNFFLGGHMNPMGYMFTAKITAAYIDYIIRHNMEDFAQVGFIGTEFHNRSAKW